RVDQLGELVAGDLGELAAHLLDEVPALAGPGEAGLGRVEGTALADQDEGVDEVRAGGFGAAAVAGAVGPDHGLGDLRLATPARPGQGAVGFGPRSAFSS